MCTRIPGHVIERTAVVLALIKISLCPHACASRCLCQTSGFELDATNGDNRIRGIQVQGLPKIPV